ncbi:MAG: hypothetical protein R3C10_01960 [Pirellulales bacterium]
MRRALLVEFGRAVVGTLLDDDREGNVLEPQGDLHEFVLGRRGQLGRVVGELVVVEDEVRAFGVGLLRLPERIAHLSQWEGPIVRRPVGASPGGPTAASPQHGQQPQHPPHTSHYSHRSHLLGPLIDGKASCLPSSFEQEGTE